jgi:hypothetical protein
MLPAKRLVAIVTIRLGVDADLRFNAATSYEADVAN